MPRFLLIFIIFELISFKAIFAQNEDYQLGMSPNYVRQTQGAFYDYSNPDGINIRVAVWGYVKFPGRYVIPERSDIKDLISFAGGISDDSYMDDMRIYRINPDSSQTLLKYNYDDLWWNENLNQEIKLEKLQPGDLLVIPGRPRLYWENYLTLTLSIVGVLLSLATLIITANN